MKNQISRINTRNLLLFSILFLIILVSLAVTIRTRNEQVFNSNSTLNTAARQNVDTEFPRPQSLGELTAKADVIVVGTVGQIVNQDSFLGYDQDGNLIKASNADKSVPNPPQNWQFFDYSILVEQTFKDDGILSSGRMLILRMPGDRTGKVNPNEEYPMSATGDHHLFFLSRNPDKRTYGLYYGPRSRLIIDSPIVTFSDGSRTPVDISSRTAPAEFIQALMVTLGK